MMNAPLVRIYAALLRLYPRTFYTEFADEMQDSFEQAIFEKQTSRGILQVCLLEMRDFPLGVVREYWFHTARRKNAMQDDMGYLYKNPGDKPSLDNGHQPQTWKDGALAGLPHALFAVLMIVVTLTTSLSQAADHKRVFEIIGLIYAWATVAAFFIAVIIAWRKGWPRWSASYYFYIFIALSVPSLWLIQDHVGMPPLFFYLIPLALWIFKVTQRDAVKGLLMITPIAILSWFPVLEFIPNQIRDFLQLGMFLVTALTAILIARFGNWRAGIWTIIGASMLVGMPISYFRTFHHDIPPQYASSGNIAILSDLYTGALLWSAMFVVAPLLIWVFWELSNRCGREGNSGFRFIFFGILLNLAGSLLASFLYATSSWYSMHIKRFPILATESVLILLIIGGALFFITGMFILLKAARKNNVIKNDLTAALFIGTAVGLPLIFMFPMFNMRRIAQTSLPFGLFYENNVPDMFTYGLGALWLLLGAVLISRLRVPSKPDSGTPASCA